MISRRLRGAAITGGVGPGTGQGLVTAVSREQRVEGM